MTRGIYCYIDKKNNEIVYVGKDSNIHKDKRHGDHFTPSKYDEQQINRVLQNNPDRYIYQRLWEIENCTDNHLNEMEKYYVKKYNPQFNFTEGGDGCTGYKWSDEQKEKISGENSSNWGHPLPEKTKRKISEKMKGKNNPMYGRIGKKSPTYGRKHTEEERQKMSEKWKGRIPWNKGKKLSDEHKRKISKNHANVSGKNHPRAKYALWDIFSVNYHKSDMFNRGRQPNPCRCFGYKYKGFCLPIGSFHDFITPEIINNLISDALNE